MKLGMIVRQDNTGLGNQTRSCAYMLHPDRIMIVDSTSFGKGEQHPEWYEGFSDKFTVNGEPSNDECQQFLLGLDVVFTCETPYNYNLVKFASRKGIKVFTQYNWEFLDYLIYPTLIRPHMFVAPSHWHFNDLPFENKRYLPPPITTADFEQVLEANMKRKGVPRFLHVAGQPATKHRNGTDVLINALRFAERDFELVITSQRPEYNVDDNRVHVSSVDVQDYTMLYKDYDFMILPRKYGGLCLPMNEALSAGLPVIMTNISPNNEVLPQEWLVDALPVDEFTGRTKIDVCEPTPISLGKKLDELASLSRAEINLMKLEAFNISQQYSDIKLKGEYERLFTGQ